MRLLFVEDDIRIVSFVSKGLKEAGFVVVHVADGKSGLQLALDGSFDAAIIDIMLPEMDGLALIEELRRRRIRLPVIILSAKRTVDERVQGLQAGGDDYLTKPFAFSELLARIHALIRRANNTPEPTGITVGELHIDLLAHLVTRARPMTMRGNVAGNGASPTSSIRAVGLRRSASRPSSTKINPCPGA